MSFPNMGNMLPPIGHGPPEAFLYSQAIAQALSHELGGSRQAIKTVVRWTGASERTVKNWFSGKVGPSGEHLIALIHNSNDVFEVVLLLAGKEKRIPETRLAAMRTKISEMSALIGPNSDSDSSSE